MSIEVRHISKQYETQLAVNDVSFTVSKGEIVGFLGPNGAGKSTVMKILTGYAMASGGQASICGFDVESQKKSAQSQIGYLPEHNPVYTEMYVREYLKFVAELRGVGNAEVEKAIEITGLSPESNKKIEALSKGYRQRVGLAQALIHDPEVLILDEPTTGLDPNQLREIRQLITEIGKNKTVLLSTHIMQEVEAMCSRVIVLNKGKVVKDIDLDALRANEEQVLEVEFDYRIESVLLQRIPKVLKVENNYDNTWSIYFDSREDQRGTLFDFASENGLRILKLQRQSKGLEDIFRELTEE